MFTYAALLRTLKDAIGKDAVVPVARYCDPRLQLREDRMHVFVGDCHLLTAADAQKYPRCHFTIPGELRAALEALRTLAAREPDGIRFYQLGDLFDLWRATPGPDIADKVLNIQAEFEPQAGVLWTQRPDGLGATILAGNHDVDLRDLSGWRAPRFLLFPAPLAGGGCVFVTHGDVFDPMETLPEWLKTLAVRIAKGVDAGTADLDAGRKPVPDSGIADAELPACTLPGAALGAGRSLPKRWNLTVPPETHGLFAAATTLVNELLHQAVDVRLVVIGHTHKARIAVGTRRDNQPFVLLDCGAWFGRCHLPGAAGEASSAQLGVVVGNDVRLYQIGRRVADA